MLQEAGALTVRLGMLWCQRFLERSAYIGCGNSLGTVPHAAVSTVAVARERPSDRADLSWDGFLIQAGLIYTIPTRKSSLPAGKGKDSYLSMIFVSKQIKLPLLKFAHQSFPRP